jgi:hypothetical protein
MGELDELVVVASSTRALPAAMAGGVCERLLRDAIGGWSATALSDRGVPALRVDLTDLASRREELARTGRTTVLVAVDGRPARLIALADAPGPPPRLSTSVAKLGGAAPRRASAGNQLVVDAQKQWATRKQPV